MSFTDAPKLATFLSISILTFAFLTIFSVFKSQHKFWTIIVQSNLVFVTVSTISSRIYSLVENLYLFV